MKALSTIQKQIARLEKLVRNRSAPEYLRQEAHEAYHVLRWVIENVDWTPATLLERRFRELAAKAGKDGEDAN